MATADEKLQILSLQFYSYPDEAGGAWKYTYETGRRLAAKGHRVHLVTCKPEPGLKDIEEVGGINFHRIGVRESKSPLRLFRAIKQRVNRILDEHRIDLVHIHNPLVGFLALLNPKLWRIPKVYHLYSLWFDEERINLRGPEDSGRGKIFSPGLWARLNIIRLIEWVCFMSAARILFLSEYSKKSFEEYYPFKKSEIEVIPGGVDVGEFYPAEPDAVNDIRNALALPADQLVLLTVRRLAARMGLDRLIEAAQLVRQRNPDKPFQLVIVGKGSLADELKTLIDEHKLADHVRMEGFVSSEKLPLYYRAADVFILPTLEIEGFGLATVEALASGIPVLGTPVGGTVEILKPLDEKLLFAGTSVEDMAEGIEKFLLDPEAFGEMKPRLRDIAVEKYSWDKVVDRIEGEFLKLAGPRTPEDKN